MTVTKSQPGKYVINFTNNETLIVDKAELAFGADVITNLVQNWFDHTKKAMDRKGGQKLRARYDAATQAQKDQVDAILPNVPDPIDVE